MARGVEVAAPLPKVSFVKIDDDTFSKPAGVAENAVRGFGCECISFYLICRFQGISRVCASDNDGSEFQRPEHYIRYSGRIAASQTPRILLTSFLEPLERELAVQVEYDMDEQGAFGRRFENFVLQAFRVDMEWLDSVNAERKKEQGDRVSCETFEIIMDRLEKDWFDLVRLYCTHLPGLYLNSADRQRICPSRIWQCHLRILRVLFATTRRVRTRTQSCFVMAAIWLCIKIAMACRISLKVNGYAANAPSPPKHQ
jgi:hypothetical protein